MVAGRLVVQIPIAFGYACIFSDELTSLGGFPQQVVEASYRTEVSQLIFSSWSSFMCLMKL